jgi:hypothetical protein
MAENKKPSSYWDLKEDPEYRGAPITEEDAAVYIPPTESVVSRAADAADSMPTGNDILGIDTLPTTYPKYRGLTPQQICDKNPSYLVWMMENGKRVCSEELYRYAKEQVAAAATSAEPRFTSRLRKRPW